MAYDKIDSLFLFTHPYIQQRTEEVQGGLRWIMTSVNADVDNNGNDFTLSQSMEREGIVIRYDISKTTKSDMGGTGLGLFISKSIVETNGGKMWAQNNKEGKGATFSFTLPIRSK